MASKITHKFELDMIITPGKVFGETQIRNALVKAARGIDLPKVKLSPDISLEDSIPRITTKVRGILREVQQAIDSELTKSESGFASMKPTQLKNVQQAYRRLNTLVKSGNKLRQKEFSGGDFEKALKLFDQGYVSDGKGGRRKLTSATAPGFTDITDKRGDPLFSTKMLGRLERYTAKLREFGRVAKEASAAIAKIDSVDPLGELDDTKKKRTLGSQYRKRTDTDLGVLAERARRDAAALQSRFVSTEQAEKDRVQLAKDNVKEQNRIALAARRRRAAEEAATKTGSAREARLLRNVAAGKGVAAVAKINKGQTLSVQEHKNALVLLSRQAKKTEKQLAAMHKTDPKGLTDKTKAYEDKLERLNRTILETTASQGRLNASIRAEALRGGPPSPAFGPLGVDRKKVPRPSNAEVIGGRAFQQSGGFGAVYSVPKRELEALAAYHKSVIPKLVAEQEKLNVSTSKGSKAYDKLGQTIFNHKRDLEHATERTRQFGSATQQTSSLFRQFFRYALGYGALYQALAAVRALAAGIVDLEKSLKGIQAVTQATNKEMRLIEIGIKSVATSTQFNTKEIAEAAQILGQAGVIPAQLPAAIRATAIFASATGSAIQLSADLITSMRNVFSTLSDDSIANQLTQAINISKLTAGDLKTVISLSSQIAKSYRLTSDQYLAAVTTLRNAGLKPSTVATGLRQGLLEIFSPDSKTIKALATRYKQLGEQLSTDEIRDKFFGFSLTDSPLIAALRELQRLGFTGEGKKVFQRAFDIRAENAISALINNIGELEAASAKLTFGNAAMMAAQTQMESLAHSFSNMNAAMSVFAHDISGGVVSSLEDVVDVITDAITRLTEFNIELEATKGYGVEIQAAIATVAGVVGFRKFGGGIPGKAVVGAATAVSAVGVANAGLTDKASEGEAKTGLAKVWDTIGDGVSAVMPALIAVFGIEIFNKMRKKGSPLINSIIGPLKQSRSAAKVGEVAGKAALAAGSAGKYITSAGWIAASFEVIKKVFQSKAFAPVLSVGGFLLKILKANPILSFLSAMALLLPPILEFFDEKIPKNAQKAYKAAIKRRDRASAELKKTLDIQKEFRLSDGDYKAQAGTTAESIEKLGTDINDYQTELARFFGKNSDDVDGLTEDLIKFSSTSPEAGTTIEFGELRRLQDAVETSSVRADLTNSKLHQFGNDASSFTNRAEAMREGMLKYINHLKANSDDLDLTAKKWLEAYDREVRSNVKNRALLEGLRTRVDPVTRARDIFELLEKLGKTQNKAFDKSQELQDQEAEEIKSSTEAIEQLINKIRRSTSPREMAKLVDDHSSAMEGFSDANLEAIQQQIDILDRAREGIQAQIDRIKSTDIQDLIAQQNRFREQRAAKKLVGGSGRQARRRLASGAGASDERDARRETAAGQVQQLEGRKQAVTSIKKESQDDFNKRAAANREDSEIRAEKVAAGIVAAIEDFGSAGSGQNILNRTRPVGVAEDGTGASRRNLDILLGFGKDQTKITAQLIRMIDPVTGSLKVPLLEEGLAEFDVMRKELTKRAAEGSGVPTFNPAQYRSILSTEGAIKDAKKTKDFTFLTTTKEEENLFNILHRLKTAELKQQIDDLNQKQPIGRAEEDAVAKSRIDLDKKQADLNQKLIDDLRAARVDEAKAQLAELKRATRRKLAGYKKQFDVAIDSGDLEEADRLDQLIVGIKKQILEAEIKRLRSSETDERDIQKFIDDSEQDMIRRMTLPAVARTFATRSAARVNRETPEEPRLSEDDVTEGYLRQQGKLDTDKQRIETNAARIVGLGREISQVAGQLEREALRPAADVNQETVQIYEDRIRKLKEEIGRLTGKSQDDVGFFEGSTDQLKKGFDLKNVSAALDTSESSISNLGNTIQNDLVQGLDDVAGGFADALVEGENFTDGLRTSFANMFKQIAADMIKSGAMSFLSTAASAAGAYFAGASGGGVVEAKAAGGAVGGGMISGPGTGTSDSIRGVVTNSRGQVTRGIAVSDGEGIVTARSMKGLGVGFLNAINSASASTLKAMRRGFSAAGYRYGGVPSPIGSARLVTAGALNGMSMAPLRFASGGMVKDASAATSNITGGGGSKTVNYNFQNSVSVEASEDSGLTADDLRRLDDGINLKVQEYVEDQMRPGGVLQAVRGSR